MRCLLPSKSVSSPINITCNRLVRPTSTRAGKRYGYLNDSVPVPRYDLISDTLQMANLLVRQPHLERAFEAVSMKRVFPVKSATAGHGGDDAVHALVLERHGRHHAEQEMISPGVAAA